MPVIDRTSSITPSGDIILQPIQWFSEDAIYDDIEIESDGSDDVQDAPAKCLIKAYGATQEGASISLTVRHFTPFFYIKVFHVVTANFLSRLQEYVESKLPVALKKDIVSIKLRKRKDFWGFHNDDKFSFVQLTFSSIGAFRCASKCFKTDLAILPGRTPVRYKLYETNIEPMLRFMHIQNLSPTGWICIPAGKYTTFDKQSTCQIDITCDWNVVTRHEKDKIAPFVIASFDLECSSSHGDFPVPCKDYKKVAYEMLQAFNEAKLHELNIVDELVHIFQHDTPGGILSKVFPKRKVVDLKPLRGKVQNCVDELLQILRGKMVYRKEQDMIMPPMAGRKVSKDDILKCLTRRLGMYVERIEEKTNKYASKKPIIKWEGIFPELEGDPIIQIGTTVHTYGEKACCFKSIITLGSCDPIEGVEVTACETEEDMMMAWRDLIMRLDPDVITGYNIFGFDFWFLYERAKELGIWHRFSKLGRVQDKSCAYQEKNLSSSALGDNILKIIDMDGRVLIDIMKVVQRDHKLDSYKLDNVANHFIGLNKHDVSPNDIFRLFREGPAERKTIAEYCVQDCALCNQLMMKLEIMANNIGMSNVCHVPLSYIFMRGQGVKIFSLVSKQCREEGFVIPTIVPKSRELEGAPKQNRVGDGQQGEDGVEDDEEGYEGAIVLPPKQGIYLEEPVSVLDYASLYPSSMISENLSHDCLVLDERYNNLPGVEYLDITYDVYDYINDVKTKVGEKVCRFVQPPNGEKGVIPRILMKLLKARKDTRKKMEYTTVVTKSGDEFCGLLTTSEESETITLKRVDGTNDIIAKSDIESQHDTYDPFEQAVLDGLQLAYKVTANSLYGQIGAKTSPIYLKDIAACTTATGRKMICMARDFLEAEYNANIVYGDSVAGYTPSILRVNGSIIVKEIGDIAEMYGGGMWRKCLHDTEKESCELDKVNVETWTERGWTKIHRVIRHILAHHKRMVRVVTHSGVVDVTDDHSLVRANGEPVSSKDVKVGDDLLHAPLPTVANCRSIYAVQNNIHGFTSQLDAQTYMLMTASVENEVSVVENNGVYTIVSSHETTNNHDITHNQHAILRMREIPYDGYVYDLTTDNHHFAAGIGRLIVHNTDSVFAVFPNDGLKGHDAIMPSIHTAMEASSKFKKLIKHPHELEYEKTFFPFILFSKKRYCANKYEHDDVKFKPNSMGIALKRRDNAPIVKHIYGGVIDIILNEQDVPKSVQFLKSNLNDLISGKFPLESLIITKSLRADYKDPEKIAHKVLAERMGERDPGNKPMVNDRIPFVYIETAGNAKNVLQGERIEHPDYIRKQNLKPDYEFYITNQIMKPVLQLYALTLETLQGYKYKSDKDHFKNIETKLITEKNGDMKKVADKLGDLREAEVKKLFFDPLLMDLKNKRNGQKSIADFFKKQ